MAVYPCDWSNHRYPGAQQTIYFTSVVGAVMESRTMRLCPKHFRDSHSHIQQQMSLVDEVSAIAANCEHCNDKKAAVLFAKVFPAKEEERDYAIDLCAACLDKLGDELQTSKGRLR